MNKYKILIIELYFEISTDVNNNIILNKNAKFIIILPFTDNTNF